MPGYDLQPWWDTEPEPIGGFWKKIKKGLKKAVTPPKAVRKKLEAGIKRIKKSTLSDWITKGSILGITDPKVGKFMQKYAMPALIAATAFIPGVGEIIAPIAATVFELAMMDQAKKYGVASPEEIPSEYMAEATAYAADQANAAGMEQAAAMGLPGFETQTVSRQMSSQSKLPEWLLPVGILGVGYFLMKGKR